MIKIKDFTLEIKKLFGVAPAPGPYTLRPWLSATHKYS